jgi:N-acetylmuramoyl-L-alanine amidase
MLVSVAMSMQASTKQDPVTSGEAQENTQSNLCVESVVWQEELEEAGETSPNTQENEILIASRDWDDYDEEILMQISMAEAESEGVEGKALVMLVVLNRVWSEEFPDSVEAVVFQNNQFSTVQPGGRYWTTTPDEECMEALELVRTGWDESQGALFFEATSNTETWHKNNLQYLFQFGNHIFYTTKEAGS